MARGTAAAAASPRPLKARSARRAARASRLRAVDPDRRRLAGGGAHGEVEAVERRHEERGARTRRGGQPRKRAVAVAVGGERLDISRTATDIDALALLIDEHVVGIAAGADLGGDRAARRVARHEQRRVTEHGDDALAL